MDYSHNFYLQMRTASRFLSQKDYGGYRFAMADYAGLVPEIVKALQETAQTTGIEIVEIWLDKKEEAGFLGQIAQKVALHAPANALIVRNFSHFFYQKSGAPHIDYPAMQAINFAREALLRLNTPILFWIEKESFATLANHATDFFSQRMGSTLHFTDAPAQRPETIRIPDTVAYTDLEALALDIELWETQLLDYPPAQRIADLVLPLAAAYIHQQKPEKALSLLAQYIPQPQALSPELQFKVAKIYFDSSEYPQAESLLRPLASRKNDLSVTTYTHILFLLAKTIDVDYQKFELAFPYLQEAIALYEQKTPLLQTETQDLGVLYNDIFDRLVEYGNLSQALVYAEKMKALFEKGYATFPQNRDFKNSLAIAYSKLGDVHSSLGNLDKALTFFEGYLALRKELYATFPQNMAYKNGLAVAYSKLGDLYMSFGNLDKALTFFEEYLALEKELYVAFPQNALYKHNLGISYGKLGDLHSSLGDLDKALTFFEDCLALRKELYATFPQNMAYKNGLAISYLRLGEVHSSLGNLDKALTFFENYLALEKELYAAFPQNVDYKNELAVSYWKLGDFFRKKGEDSLAKNYFEQCEAILQALVAQSPQHKEYRNNLAVVERDLRSLM